jgi:hypothetical protein
MRTRGTNRLGWPAQRPRVQVAAARRSADAPADWRPRAAAAALAALALCSQGGLPAAAAGQACCARAEPLCSPCACVRSSACACECACARTCVLTGTNGSSLPVSWRPHAPAPAPPPTPPTPPTYRPACRPGTRASASCWGRPPTAACALAASTPTAFPPPTWTTCLGRPGARRCAGGQGTLWRRGANRRSPRAGRPCSPRMAVPGPLLRGLAMALACRARARACPSFALAARLFAPPMCPAARPAGHQPNRGRRGARGGRAGRRAGRQPRARSDPRRRRSLSRLDGPEVRRSVRRAASFRTLRARTRCQRAAAHTSFNALSTHHFPPLCVCVRACVRACVCVCVCVRVRLFVCVRQLFRGGRAGGHPAGRHSAGAARAAGAAAGSGSAAAERPAEPRGAWRARDLSVTGGQRQGAARPAVLGPPGEPSRRAAGPCSFA